MSALAADLRYALRQLRKSPGFAALAICTLAIGIGACTAIYSIVDGVLLRSFPFQDPERLVTVFESIPALGFAEIPFSAPDYTYVVQHSHSFAGMAAYRDQQSELSGTGDPVRLHAERVSASLFPVLGVSPQWGRAFTAAEDTAGAPVVVLSDAFWRQHFAASRGVLGQTLLLDRHPYTIIGVMPPGFVFPNHGEKFNNMPGEVFLPMHFSPAQLEDIGDQFNYSVIARLRPGVSAPQAAAEVNGLIHQFSRRYPPQETIPNFSVSGAIVPYNDVVVGDVRGRLLLLQLSVLLVLLIACVDVANLLLAKTSGRQRELALRIAVGAPRARILAQMLLESLVVALAGGLLGLPLAYASMRLLITQAPVDLPRAGSISLNPGVLAFCFGICLLTALLTGLLPALRALRVDPNESLYEGGRSGMAGRHRHRLLGGLVTSQFTLAMVLLVTAGLALRSFQRLAETDPGFEPDHVLTMDATLPLAAYSTKPQIMAFYRQLLARAATLPGVRSIGLTTSLPINATDRELFSIPALPSRPAATITAPQTRVMGDYFRALGIRLLRGRLFTPQDSDDSMPVVIVDQDLARKYFPGMDPIGQRIKTDSPQGNSTWLTIVGVVEDVKSRGMSQSAEPETYTPYLQSTADSNFYTDPNIDLMRNLALTVRTEQDPDSTQNLLIGAIHSLDPSLPVSDVDTMTAVVHRAVAPQRFNSFLLGIFAAIALLLAAAGIGGVLAYTVHQRTREIGVRMALGARRQDVSRLVLWEGLKLAGAGVLLGALLSLLAARWLGSQLYQVAPQDPLTFAAALTVLFAIALAACWLPARRAASVDPMQALRSE